MLIVFASAHSPNPIVAPGSETFWGLATLLVATLYVLIAFAIVYGAVRLAMRHGRRMENEPRNQRVS